MLSELTSEIRLTTREFALFRDLIYAEAGISLGDSKQQLVASRLAKRLRALGLTSYSKYYDYLMHNDRDGSERLKMINSLTTNKTDFFREDHHFDYLKSTIFPAFEQIAKQAHKRKIRIWSAACSTGEEPYTLAMTILDFFGPTVFNTWDIRILASDIDTDVLTHAQRGKYPRERIEEVPPALRKQSFIKRDDDQNDTMTIRPELQSLITFRRINFVDEAWPIHTEFDIIFCRNVMIYFDEPTQDRLLTRFASYLKPCGHLFIGHSESILRLDQIYRPIGQTIYQKVDSQPSSVNVVPSPQHSAPGKGSPSTFSPSAPRAAAQSLTQTRGDDRSEVRIPSHPIIVGEVKASREPLKISTLLGSCVSVCLFDPVAQIGGMNHFMLPASRTDQAACATYGIHAMELLINEIMKLGGDRRRLVAKVFGGGNVLGRDCSGASGPLVGDRNAEFALQFLQTDGIPVVSQDLGGTRGRHVHFLSHTGQAFVRPIQKVQEEEIQVAEKMAVQTVPPKSGPGSVELF